MGEDPNNERPLTMAADGKLMRGLPYKMMYKAGDMLELYQQFWIWNRVVSLVGHPTILTLPRYSKSH